MSEIASLERALWGISFFLNGTLVFLIFHRRNHKVYPFFTTYVVLTFLQNIVFYESYRVWGFYSQESVWIAWGSQSLVTAARALAVAEVCYRVLAGYRGVWRLAWRLLLGAGALVFLYSWALSRGSWQFAILNLDRALELMMASVIVLLVFFARCYEMTLESPTRELCIGLFLYSSFRVLNDSMWGRWLDHYTALWGLLGTLTFLASLLLWTWALRVTLQQKTAEPEMISKDLYRSLSPAINARLKSLNEQLGHFWSSDGEKT